MNFTLISGTNRINSNTRKVSEVYLQRADRLGMSCQLLDLADLPMDCFGPCSEDYLHPALKDVQETLIRPAGKLIVVSPEYNGSIPGVLKALLDFTDVKAWYDKKACLVGVATGRAGNLRGLDHLTNIFLHCRIQVLPNKLPISRVKSLLQEKDGLDAPTLEAVDRQLEQFLHF